MVSFVPITAFQAGETLTAVLTSGGTTRHVWQFTTAASGPGSFGGGSNLPITAYPFGTVLVSIGTADLNGDGNVDVAVGEVGTNPSSIAFNSGGGQLFRGPYFQYASYNMPQFPLADVDGDGDFDLINLRNTGLGVFVSFANPPSLLVNSAYDGLFADFDGDGDLDHAHMRTSALRIAHNDGSGSFTITTSPVQLQQNGLLSAGDLDNDGDVDLVNYKMPQGSGLDVLLNDGQGIFTLAASYITPSRPSLSPNNVVVLGDVDGDGDLDLIIPAYSAFAAIVLINNGQGAFTQGIPIGSGVTSNIETIALGDVDGDGDLDVLAGGASTALFLNNGSGVFAYGGNPVPNVGSYGGARLADMNNDGTLDVVIAQPGNTPGQPGTGVPGVLAIRLNSLATASRAETGTTFEVEPNPVAQASTLHIKLPTLARRGTWQLHAALGQVVRAEVFAGQTVAIPTAGLVPGLYLLTVQADAQAPLTQRVVVE